MAMSMPVVKVFVRTINQPFFIIMCIFAWKTFLICFLICLIITFLKCFFFRDLLVKISYYFIKSFFKCKIHGTHFGIISSMKPCTFLITSRITISNYIILWHLQLFDGDAEEVIPLIWFLKCFDKIGYSWLFTNLNEHSLAQVCF